jgi:xanthine dehydrogenase accessory factor
LLFALLFPLIYYSETFVMNIFHEIDRELGQSREVVLATIVVQKGSAPRAPGTRFLIRPDGSFEGSIGGGKVEADVLTEAPKVFAEKKNRIIRFRLTGEEAAETEMICGGKLEIHLELFSGGNVSHREFFTKIIDLQQKGTSAIVATLLEEGQSASLSDSKFIYVPGEDQPLENIPWITPVRKNLPGIFSKGQPVLLTAVDNQGKEKNIFLEPIKALPHLYIFGAGHVSSALCPLAKTVGFQVTVFDDRPEFANSSRFPEADNIFVRPFAQSLDDFPFPPNAFVVIMTRGHLNDYQVLRQVLGKSFRHIGMIGSRNKREVIFKALRQENFSEDLIKTVHTPIGLDIKAETPEEIAVSIVAELIQVRNQNQTHKKKILTLPQ